MLLRERNASIWMRTSRIIVDGDVVVSFWVRSQFSLKKLNKNQSKFGEFEFSLGQNQNFEFLPYKDSTF